MMMVQGLHDHDLELPQTILTFWFFPSCFPKQTQTLKNTLDCRQYDDMWHAIQWRVTVITHEPYFRKAHKLNDDHEVTFGRCQLCNQAKAISIQLI